MVSLYLILSTVTLFNVSKLSQAFLICTNLHQKTSNSPVFHKVTVNMHVRSLPSDPHLASVPQRIRYNHCC